MAWVARKLGGKYLLTRIPPVRMVRGAYRDDFFVMNLREHESQIRAEDWHAIFPNITLDPGKGPFEVELKIVVGYHDVSDFYEDEPYGERSN